MVSTSGSLLLSHSSISTLVTRLLPLSTVLTPNLPEAEQLLDHARVDATSSSAGTEADRAPASSSQPPKAKEEITTLRQMLHAARSLALLGPQAVLVKGGHRPMRRSDVDAALTAEVGTAQGAAEEEPSRKERVHVVRSDTRPVAEVLRVWRSSGAAARTREEKEEDYEQVVVDVLYERSAASAQNRPQAVSHPANGLDAHCDGQWIVFVKPRVASDATHGTGCTLSSALATYLGFGHSIADAASQGITYVQRAIASGLEEIGSGPGPLDHASGIIRPAVPVPTRHDPTPLCTSLITTSRTLWLRFTQHDFVRGISSLTLPRESFLWFLKQDYLFLRAYARVWALASSKADASWADTARFADAAGAMAKEAEMHVGLCARWGIERKTLEREQESAATIAYTRFVLDVGHARGLLDLLVATAPCLIGYGEVGRWLRAQAHAQSSRAEVGEKAELKRAYDEWIEGYAGDEFQETVRLGIGAYKVAPKDRNPCAKDMIHSLPLPLGLQRNWNATPSKIHHRHQDWQSCSGSGTRESFSRSYHRYHRLHALPERN